MVTAVPEADIAAARSSHGARAAYPELDPPSSQPVPQSKPPTEDKAPRQADSSRRRRSSLGAVEGVARAELAEAEAAAAVERGAAARMRRSSLPAMSTGAVEGLAREPSAKEAAEAEARVEAEIEALLSDDFEGAAAPRAAAMPSTLAWLESALEKDADANADADADVAPSPAPALAPAPQSPSPSPSPSRRASGARPFASRRASGDPSLGLAVSVDASHDAERKAARLENGRRLAMRPCYSTLLTSGSSLYLL